MKLIDKLFFSFLAIAIIFSIFSSSVLIYNLNQTSKNLIESRESEVNSFIRIIDTIEKIKVEILEENILRDEKKLSKLFHKKVENLEHLDRLTLHTFNKDENKHTHKISTDLKEVGTPSHPEDLEAILYNRTTLIHKIRQNGNHCIDITTPITDINGDNIAALGVVISIQKSEEILSIEMTKMKQKAIDNILLTIIFSIAIASLFALVVAKRITLPLNKLTDAITSISKIGSYEKIEVTTNDELGILTKEFNKMSAELNILHTEMQHSVDSKTDEIEQNYLVDALTGLPNRTALFKDIAKMSQYHLAILDIASFKDINDVYGIEIGSSVINKVSSKYREFLINSGLKLYRISGDETVVINPHVESKDDFIHNIDSLIKYVESETLYFENSDIEIRVSLNAGITFSSYNSVEKANTALIQAKKQQLNYVVCEVSISNESEKNRTINTISKIRSATDNYGFIVYYQPIVDRDDNILKYEALVRMEDGNEILSPVEFLELSKKSKQYSHITKTVIHTALSKFEDRQELISVNITVHDIKSQRTREFIINQLSAFKEPSRVIFEIIDSADIYDIANLYEFILSIKDLGAKIAIDNFGVGYSNLLTLLELQPDYIKIDGSLIKNILSDKKSKDIVTTIIHFAHSQNIKVIAEHIDAQDIKKEVLALGVDELQGYLIAKPSPDIE